MKVAFSDLYFCSQNFSIDILHVLRSIAFTWCEEWVIAVQAILW